MWGDGRSAAAAAAVSAHDLERGEGSTDNLPEVVESPRGKIIESGLQLVKRASAAGIHSFMRRGSTGLNLTTGRGSRHRSRGSSIEEGEEERSMAGAAAAADDDQASVGIELTEEQRDDMKVSDEAFDQMAVEVNGMRVLTEARFCRLMSEPKLNGALKHKERSVWHDMRQPMERYICDSSHNTYLEAHQWVGRASVDMYRRVLLQGCRCIELDCWDGDEGMPKITHGHTLTGSIKCHNVLEAINEFAFEASPYPLVLSLEMHCSPSQTRVLARQLQRTFEGKLVFPFPSGMQNLPSPEELRGKVLVKAKVNPDLAGPRTVSQETRLAGPLYVVAPELGIYKQRALWCQLWIALREGGDALGGRLAAGIMLYESPPAAPPAPAPEESDVGDGSHHSGSSVASKEREIAAAAAAAAAAAVQPIATEAAPWSAAPSGTPTTRTA